MSIPMTAFFPVNMELGQESRTARAFDGPWADVLDDGHQEGLGSFGCTQSGEGHCKILRPAQKIGLI